jgi:hypothetical protein
MEGMGVKRKLSQIPHLEWITKPIKSWLFTWIWCYKRELGSAIVFFLEGMALKVSYQRFLILNEYLSP